jgi:GNAT superfamily N-acetyltransferase
VGSDLGERELRRRAFDGLNAEIEAFGNGPGSSLIRREGLIASISPLTPDRSIFNSVRCEGPNALGAAIGELGDAYAAGGVRAWTVWVADEDRRSAELLAGRGHLPDAAPRAMAMTLEGLASEPPAPAGMELAPCDPGAAAALNDRAYGYEKAAFRAVMGEGNRSPIRWLAAYAGVEPCGCVGTIELGDDCVVTGVATPSEHQRRGIAGWILHRALAGARERGLTSASLQASRAGAPLYERLGFRDFGFFEMWELRRPE